MTRLIDADAYEQSIRGNPYVSDSVKTYVRCSLQSQPTIDAVPVRHCKNEGTDYADVDQFVCSECGIELQEWVRIDRDEDDGEVTHHEYVFRYCPHCGARMDEECA